MLGAAGAVLVIGVAMRATVAIVIVVLAFIGCTTSHTTWLIGHSNISVQHSPAFSARSAQQTAPF